MKFLPFSLLLFVLLPSLSYGQAASSPLYDESDYVRVSRDLGPEATDEPFTVWYKYGQDSSYALKKIYLDSAQTQLLEKVFYKDGLPEGPFYGYWNGSLTVQGTYKKGHLDGERLSYQNSKLVQRSYFTDGLNSGTWELFDETEKLIRQITYNSRGQVKSDIIIQ
jgi:antitoxin component YwqK of YwqJK toxin-antitoxin module